jgi:hypothetical protein
MHSPRVVHGDVAALALLLTTISLGPLGAAVPGAVAGAPCEPDAADMSRTTPGAALDEAAPELVKASPIGKALRGLLAFAPERTLEVDERHTRFLLVGDKAPPATRLALALPAPWSGFFELVPKKEGGRFCARANVVLFDGALRRAELAGLPLEARVSIGRRGRGARTVKLAQAALTVSPDEVQVHGADSTVRLFLAGAVRGPPREELLEGQGAARYLEGLAAIFPEVVEDIRARPSAEAQRVLFAEMAESLRADLRLWTPAQRLKGIARFDEKAMPPEQRPLLRFWKAELEPAPAGRRARGERTARLLIDDAVRALWIDGVEVFDRQKGTPTSVEVRALPQAVRAWIVTHESASPERGSAASRSVEVVHDTRAVLRPGEIYSVTSTFVQHLRGGPRRECVRVGGALPFEKDIRWREVSGTNTNLLDHEETYRPSVPSAERVITVVPGGDARPFPPVPLIYSYTHPGTYKWTLAPEGGATLELVEDPALCR